jgi:hypothetical protein
VATNPKSDTKGKPNAVGVMGAKTFRSPELGGDVLLFLFRPLDGVSTDDQVGRILDFLRPRFPISPHKALVLQAAPTGSFSATPSFVFMKRGDDFVRDASEAELASVIKALGSVPIK